MFIALYVSHGVNVRTTSAMLGTLASLAITALLALLFVELTQLTGFASEEATYIQVASARINLQGILLGGIIIGSLGVLDDVTVTQASAVWELHLANPAMRAATSCTDRRSVSAVTTSPPRSTPWSSVTPGPRYRC